MNTLKTFAYISKIQNLLSATLRLSQNLQEIAITVCYGKTRGLPLKPNIKSVMCCAIWYQTLKNGVQMVGQNPVLTSYNAFG